MPDESHSRTTPSIPLKALAQELRCRCEAVCRFSGGHTYYREELSIFRSFAHENNLFLEEDPVTDRPCDDEGNEHQVWFSEDRSRVVKVTFPDFFGKLVIYRQGEESNASPIQFLERWNLHNEIFGDDAEFLGVVDAQVSGLSRREFTWG